MLCSSEETYNFGILCLSDAHIAQPENLSMTCDGCSSPCPTVVSAVNRSDSCSGDNCDAWSMIIRY